MGRGYPGKGRLFHRGVAIAAIQTDIADVVLVAERHDLFCRRTDRRVRRDADAPAENRNREQHQHDQRAELEHKNEARLEDLGHALLVTPDFRSKNRLEKDPRHLREGCSQRTLAAIGYQLA